MTILILSLMHMQQAAPLQILRITMFKRLKIFFILCLLLLSSFLTLFFFRFPLSKKVGRLLMQPRQIEKSDVIVVMGGGIIQRLPYALSLLDQGYSQNLWYISPGISSLDQAFYDRFGFAPHEFFAAQEIFEKLNFPKDHYKILPNSISTYTDLLLLKEAILAHPVSSVLIVSDPYHFRRINYCIAHIFKEMPSIQFFYAYPDPEKGIDSLLDRDDLPIIVLYEVIKNIVYAIEFPFFADPPKLEELIQTVK